VLWSGFRVSGEESEMGMFDTVNVDCPSCGEKESLGFQSKSGECTLADYTMRDAPDDVLSGLQNYPVRCKNCNKSFSPVVRVTEVAKVFSVALTEVLKP
jgi:NMD protein affecting ribosome stability and mRNA decay